MNLSATLRAAVIPVAILASLPVSAAPEIVVEQPSGTPISTTVMTGFGRSYNGLIGKLGQETHLVSPYSAGAEVTAVRNNGPVVAINHGGTPPVVSDGVQYVSGGLFQLALRANGIVVGTGSDSDGVHTVPSTLTNVTQIAAGSYHALALRSNGTVVAWGDNSFDQTSVPSGLTGVVAIEASHLGSYALKSDGSVVSWGSHSVFGSLTGVASIDARNGTLLAAKTDGTVEIFSGSTPPVGLTGVTQVSTAGGHNLALKSDGSLVAWGGFNDYGELTLPAGLGPVNRIFAIEGTSLVHTTGVSFPMQTVGTTGDSKTLPFVTQARPRSLLPVSA